MALGIIASHFLVAGWPESEDFCHSQPMRQFRRHAQCLGRLVFAATQIDDRLTCRSRGVPAQCHRWCSSQVVRQTSLSRRRIIGLSLLVKAAHGCVRCLIGHAGVMTVDVFAAHVVISSARAFPAPAMSALRRSSPPKAFPAAVAAGSFVFQICDCRPCHWRADHRHRRSGGVRCDHRAMGPR